MTTATATISNKMFLRRNICLADLGRVTQSFMSPQLQAEKSCPAMYLLVKANVVSLDDLTAAMEQAAREKKSVEEVLRELGLITEALAKNAIEAREFMQANNVMDVLALEGLRIACRKGVSFRIGLIYLGWGW